MKPNAVIVLILLLIVLAFSVSCAGASPTSVPPSPTFQPTYTPFPTYTPYSTQTPYPTFTPLPTQTATLTPSRTPTPIPTPTKPYTSAFGIDYTQPSKYLTPGEQSRMSNTQVIDSLRGKPQSIAHLGQIYFWIKSGFTAYAAGGAYIGKVTTDQLLTERRLSGCHDWALVYASLVRELGYPAVLVDAAGVSWAKRFRAGQKGSYLGHVFVEVFVAGKWVLIDSTNNWYVEVGYDPTHAFIPIKMGDETEGMFVMRKAVDTWGYGIHSNAELMRLMEQSANALKLETIKFPPYHFLRFQ
ncbi:MAG: transglutaminase domain-containing protein [Chloroflexi bacterium]|nr:transglutaminase domain-containing protein [Chloroflexota bacterium]